VLGFIVTGAGAGEDEGYGSGYGYGAYSREPDEQVKQGSGKGSAA
jgi:hypothetical protein